MTPPALVDTHVHLDDGRYDADRDAVLRRAREAGVWPLVTIGTNLEDSRWACGFADSTDGIYAAVGQHPERAGEMGPGDLDGFRALASAGGKVVAVGEVGLDLHRPGSSLAVQEPVLRAMLALAREAGLPLVIHAREAFDALFAVLREAWDAPLGGIFHCFSGDLAAARAALDMNFDLAAGGVATFKGAGDLRGVLAQVPLDRLVLETDGPWLAPQARRGQRNEPAFVAEVAAQVAVLHGVPVEEVARRTTANARRVFRLPPAAGGVQAPEGAALGWRKAGP